MEDEKKPIKNIRKSEKANSYTQISKRFNELVSNFGYLPPSDFLGAFMRAGAGLANMPQIQNRRIKNISSLPADYTKEDIGSFLRNPYSSERALRQTSEILKWTSYPYYKIIKTYQDIPTYRYTVTPLYSQEGDAEKSDFWREAVLLDKFMKTLRPDVCAHKIAGQALTSGKVFYILRKNIDKSHNKVNYAFMQQLPEDYCTIIGHNSVSGYTISFDMMYFLQPGTDYRQFGDLFLPYIDDFENMFFAPSGKGISPKTVYSSKCGKNLSYYPENIRERSAGNPKTFMQNGRYMYYVSLPADAVWTFETDDTSAAAASPLSGLMLTYSQQSDYEQAQLSLILNPLIKIFTGEIPYRDDGASKEDTFSLSVGMRMMFEEFFGELMNKTNTGGVSFYSAPFQNIKSHDFAESANANEISESFVRYGIEKAGLSSIIPATSDPKAGIANLSAKLESRFCFCIYSQMERLLDFVIDEMNLNYHWKFRMFSDIYSEETRRGDLEKAVSRGDLSAYFELSALDGESVLDKIAKIRMMKALKLSDLLEVPPNANTQTGFESHENGRPKKTIDKIISEGAEASEKTTDTKGVI